MAAKQRLDTMLVARGLAESRAKAQALALAGLVYSGERRLDKPGQMIADDKTLESRCPGHPDAARGAIALDIGASSGGFTDVLLRRGAVKVFAVDVGHGQLDWRLRQDSRVVVLERCNARNLTRSEIPEPPTLVVCDASFIGLETIL